MFHADGNLWSRDLEDLRAPGWDLALFGRIDRFVAHSGRRDAPAAAMTSDVGTAEGRLTSSAESVAW